MSNFMCTIMSVVGARPNFMKLAPVARALNLCADVRHVIVHTGQHYDVEMSAGFFRDLEISSPHHNLEVGSGSHAQQTGLVMQRFETVLLRDRPDVVLVYGDVNSTVAAALVAAKLGVPVGHVEAGLRSGDWSMPEEINRVVTDRLADLLFTPSRCAGDNLLAEGVPNERIHFVGNVMIDSLVFALPAARASGVLQRYRVTEGRFAVTTLHRPSNVDDPARLRELMGALERLSSDLPVIFPVHPRTRDRILEAKLQPANRALKLVEPLGYLEMLGLVASAGLVVTDSGGLQEESTYLGVPCLTVRPNTERPVTVSEGTNRLEAPEAHAILSAARAALDETRQSEIAIERWDGGAAERVAQVLTQDARFR